MRIAVVAHAFYEDVWPEVADCIVNLKSFSPDVFVTVPTTASCTFVEAIRRRIPSAKIFRVENRGYDVGPFFYVIGWLDISRYDYVVKLHTKRNRIGFVNYLPLVGNAWRKKLLWFLSTEARAIESMRRFDRNENVGMVGHGELIQNSADEMDGKRHGLDQTFDFVAGTVFAIRAVILEEIRKKAKFEDFELMSGRGTCLAHEFEREFGRETCRQGYRVAGIPIMGRRFKRAMGMARLLYGWLFRRNGR